LRIHRDIRFSKDKSPYKTAIGAHFWHASGKEGAAPGYFLRLAPGDSLLGAGIWQPEPHALKGIRDAIVNDSKRWKQATSQQRLGATCQMGGESLQRPPRGYDPNHPAIEDIKRKNFTVGRSVSDAEVLDSDFLHFTLDTFRAAAPFVGFLSGAVGLR